MKKAIINLKSKKSGVSFNETNELNKSDDQTMNIKTLVNPADFEEIYFEIKNNLSGDYAIVEIPENDVEINIIPRKQTIFNNGVPLNIQDIYASNLLAKLCIEFYTSDWIVTCYKDLSYNGAFWSLPNIHKYLRNIKEQKFVIDDEKDKDNENLFTFKTKGIYLDSLLALCTTEDYQIFLKSKDEDSRRNSSEILNYKKYTTPEMILFSLSELSDGTKILRESMPREGHVEEILYIDIVDSIVELDENWIKVSFKTKQKPVCLYTGCKENQELWITNLNDAINTPSVKVDGSGPLDSIERVDDTVQDMLFKILQESEESAMELRTSDHQNILSISPDILDQIRKKSRLPQNEDMRSSEKSVLDDSLIRSQVEQRSPRLYFRVTAQKLLTSIYFSPDTGPNKNVKTVPEPFFISCYLVHVNDNRRISEEFRWNPNHASIENLLPRELFVNKWAPKEMGNESTDNFDHKTPLDLPTFSNQALQNCKSFLLKSPYEQDQVGILIRIDKVFNGPLSSWVDKYVKHGGITTKKTEEEDDMFVLEANDNKIGHSIHKSMSIFCANIGHYRMPFCWSFCKLKSRSQVKLPLYKYDGTKTADEDLFKQIHNLNFDSVNKVMLIPGYLEISVEEVMERRINNMTDLINSEYNCKIKCNPSEGSVCCKEIKEFIFDPLHANNTGSMVNYQSKSSSFVDSSSVSSNSRPNSNYTSTSGLDASDGNSSGNVTPSGDVYNSNFFSPPLTTNMTFDSLSDNGSTRSSNQGSAKKAFNSINQEDLVIPFLDFAHTLYLYPRMLNFANQNIFHRARNLSCFVELRNSDKPEISIPLKVIFSKSSNKQSAFDSLANTLVVYHDACPTFNDEVKVALPTNLNAKHHFLFRFYHVSCDTAGTSIIKDKLTAKKPIETPVGFAWMPLLDKNFNLNNGKFNLPVATNLPPNYLDDSNLITNIQWVDSQKPLFSIVLKPESTIYTQNVHLHRFFRICSEKLPSLLTCNVENGNGIHSKYKMDTELCDQSPEDISNCVTGIRNAIKALASIEVNNLIQFLGPTFNQLFIIIVNTSTTYPKISETAVTSFITLSSTLRGQSVECLSSRAVRRNTTILKNYIKYSFDADKIVSQNNKSATVHDCLVQTISELISPTFRDTNFMHSFLHNSFLLYSVIVKSMIQSKMKWDKLKTNNSETTLFTTKFTSYLENMIHLVVNCILETSSDSTSQQGISVTLRRQNISSQSLSSSANKDLARFVARLFNVMDRAFVFRGIHLYMKVVNGRIKASPTDCELLSKLKFEFLEIICQHEHFILLNLNKHVSQVDKEYSLSEFYLSETFCQEHYLIGLVLQQVHQHMCNTSCSYSIRGTPFVLLRNMLVKHTFDDRYSSDDAQKFQIIRLYLPFISIVLENQKALSMPGISYSNKKTVQNPNDSSDKSLSSRGINADNISTHSSIDGSGSDGGGGSIYGVGTGTGAWDTKPTRSSLAYLDKTGRVESHFLNMIAGLNSDGKMRDLSTRRNVDSDTCSMHSTNTLTGLDESEEGENASLGEEMVIHTNIELSDSSSRRGSVNSSLYSNTGSLGRRIPATLNLKRHATSVHSNQRISSGLGVNAANTGINKNNEYKSSIYLKDKIQKDIFLCLIHIFNAASSDDMKAIVANLTIQERSEFLQLLIYSIHHLKYQGKKAIYDFESISCCEIKSVQGQAMLRSNAQRKNANRTTDEHDQKTAILEGNVSTEVGLVVLDVMSLYCSVYKEEILNYNPDHALFRRIIDVYLALLVVNQSDSVLRHVLVCMRIFVNRFARVIFASCHSVICDLSLHVLRYCDSRSSNVRIEACGFLYRMMRSSYETFGKQGFNRVHLQMIVAVSKLDRVDGRRFNQSLCYLRELAELEGKKAHLKPSIKPKPVSRLTTSITGPIFKMDMHVFYEDVSDLTQRIRTVLMATVKMNEHRDDTEMLVDLQYSLAKSYSSNPALRRTWLEKIISVHEKTKSKAEIAMCKAHIVAMICEFLKRKDSDTELYSLGCANFLNITPNIPKEESSIRDDSVQLEVNYAKDEVVQLLRDLAQAFDAAGLWEVLKHIYRLLIPIYEKKKDYEQLSQVYEHLAAAYSKIKNSEANNQRLIGSFYLVVFNGKPFQTLSGKRFIYRLDSGKQFCVAREELQVLFEKKYGAENVNMLVENYVDLETLDPNLASIHVSHVDPYFTDSEELERQSMFERQYNISQFMLEIPFIKESLDELKDILKSKQTDDLSIQWKRRTILTVEASFPHLKRRLEVVSSKEIDFSPIERAIDEIKSKNRQLITDLTFSKQSSANNKQLNDSSHSGNINLLMDMHLTGALLPQVNQGPMAYARVFLQKESQVFYPTEKVNQLKLAFMEFLSLCNLLLLDYQDLMSKIHDPKHKAMRSSLDKYRIELSNLLNEEITLDQEKKIICTSALSDSLELDLMKRLGLEVVDKGI